MTKKCSVKVSTNTHLHCEKCNITLQNPTVEAENLFYQEHGNGEQTRLIVDANIDEARKQSFFIFGTTNLQQAFEQAARDKDTIKNLHDRNTAQGLHIQRLDDVFQVTNTIIESIEDSGIMLLTPTTRNAITMYRDLYKEIEKRLQEALSL